MFKKIMSVLIAVVFLFGGYVSYMTMTTPFYLDSAEAAVKYKEGPYLKYGHPQRPALIDNAGRPCIPYPNLKYTPNRYSKWVYGLQRELNRNHNFRLREDGYYGKQTALAVNQVKVRFNMRTQSGMFVGWEDWYVIIAQKSRWGWRYRLSAPPKNFTSHDMTYKLIYRPDLPQFNPALKNKPKPKPVIHPKSAFPVARPYYMYKNWHAPRFPNRLHKGIDISARKGTPLYAIGNGKIIAVGNGGLGGLTLWLQTGNQFWYYAHNSRNLVKVGQYVKAGQKIAEVGNTGNARYTGSHLHIGLKYGGRSKPWVNPYPILKSLQ